MGIPAPQSSGPGTLPEKRQARNSNRNSNRFLDQILVWDRLFMLESSYDDDDEADPLPLLRCSPCAEVRQ